MAQRDRLMIDSAFNFVRIGEPFRRVDVIAMLKDKLDEKTRQTFGL